MFQPRHIDDHISVAPQIAPEDMGAIAEGGFTMIVNNRPDGEDSGQPDDEAVKAAAEAAGMGYAYIPITHAGFSGNQIEAMAQALGGSEGPVLAFCRSGTRSVHLWALASASEGGDPGELTGKAAAAGYDISGIKPLLDSLAGGQ